MQRFFIFLLIGSSVSYADVTIEAVIKEGASKIWVSGLKKRTDIPNSLLGSKTSVVTIVNEGIERKFDSELKFYEEKPLESLPKNSEEDIVPSQGKTDVKKLYTIKIIAGQTATAYKITFPTQKTLTLWIGPSNKVLEEAEKEISLFQEAYFKKIGKRQELNLMLLTSFFHEEIAKELLNIKDLPKGFILGMEARDPSLRTNMMLFEIKSISTTPIQSQVFPNLEGYKKVRSLMEEQIKGMKGD